MHSTLSVDRLLAVAALRRALGPALARCGPLCANRRGSARNVPFPLAWRYRDYVIDAFNEDKPYDQFIREQLAGDLLPAASDAQRNEQLIATGFLAVGVKDLRERKSKHRFRHGIVDEQIDTTSRALLGLTIACARCHDHKFDPIPTADYYALAGIFSSTEPLLGRDASELRGSTDRGRAATRRARRFLHG